MLSDDVTYDGNTVRLVGRLGLKQSFWNALICTYVRIKKCNYILMIRPIWCLNTI